MAENVCADTYVSQICLRHTCQFVNLFSLQASDCCGTGSASSSSRSRPSSASGCAASAATTTATRPTTFTGATARCVVVIWCGPFFFLATLTFNTLYIAGPRARRRPGLRGRLAGGRAARLLRAAQGHAHRVGEALHADLGGQDKGMSLPLNHACKSTRLIGSAMLLQTNCTCIIGSRPIRFVAS